MWVDRPPAFFSLQSSSAVVVTTKHILAHPVEHAEEEPTRMSITCKRRPGDGRVQDHVAQLVERGIEPAAQFGGRPLDPGEVAVRRVEHQGQGQGQCFCQVGLTGRPRECDGTRGPHHEEPEARVTRIGPDPGGTEQPGNRQGWEQRPVSTQGLVRLPAGQLGLGALETVRLVEPPEYGRLGIFPFTQARGSRWRSYNRSVRRIAAFSGGGPVTNSYSSSRTIGEQSTQPRMLFKAGVDHNGRVVERVHHVEEVPQHATTLDELAGQGSV